MALGKIQNLTHFVAVIAILAQASLFLVSWGTLPPEVPLFYTRPWGEQILAPTIFLWILPGVALLSLILNFILTKILAGDDLFLRRVLALATGLVAITTLYNSSKIVSLLI